MKAPDFILPDISFNRYPSSQAPDFIIISLNIKTKFMKTARFLLLVLFTAISISTQAQGKENIYRIQIKFLNGDIVKGYLIALNDSSITLIQSIKHAKDTTFSISQIKDIRLRKKHAVGTGFLAGSVSGGITGAFIGYGSYSPCDDTSWCLDAGPELSALGGAFIGIISGGILGLATGTANKKFDINGDTAMYTNFRNNTDLFGDGKK